jgi:hypothetical protein
MATSMSPIAVATPRSAIEVLRILSGKLSPRMLIRPRWREWSCERLRGTSTTIVAGAKLDVGPTEKNQESIR